MLGLLAILVTFGTGCLLSFRVLRLGGILDGIAVGLGLAVALFLLATSLLLQAGVPLSAAVLLAPVPLALLVGLSLSKPDAPRPCPQLPRWESAALLIMVLAAWLFTNMMQVITVDDDYWLHTPVQARMLRGVIPPTNPFFPDLVLGGHFGRDLLVVSTSLLSGRMIFGAQVLVTSFCHSLGLAVLYLALRRSGNSISAGAGTAMIWLGMNVAHRVGLVDFFQNNGPPTYLLLALLMYLFNELWRQPGRKLALLCGAVLGVYAQVYETHFGLVVLTVLCMLTACSRQARLATLLALSVAAVLAVTGGTALSRLTRPSQPLDEAIANQSQSVQMSFPKSPFLALRIEAGEFDPVSCGYRVGLGKPLLAAIDHVPKRSHPRYVRLWSWNVMRMHWMGVWLAPLSAWLLWRARHRAGQFLWLFGAWAFLVPGMINFGPIHEFEWYRWEFAAGYGFAGALGVALGTLVRGWRSGLAVVLAVALNSQAGLSHLRNFVQYLSNPQPSEVLGVTFGSGDWLLRHGDHLRFRQSDLRALAWIRANPKQGRGCFVSTTGPAEAWGILFESTAMALTDIQVLGHMLPPKGEPVGVPPYRITLPFLQFLDLPSPSRAEALGIDWLLLRSDDFELEKRLMQQLRLVYFDHLAPDGKRRLLFTRHDAALIQPADPLTTARFVTLDFRPIPTGADKVGLGFLDGANDQMGSRGWLPADLEELSTAVPAGCRSVELYFTGTSGTLERRLIPVKAETTPPDG